MSFRLKSLALVGLGSLLYAASSSPNAMPTGARAFLDQRCIACHGSDNPQAGLDLTAIGFDLDDQHNRDRWVRIHDGVSVTKRP